MVLYRKSSYGKKQDARRPELRDRSGRDSIDIWEDEGGSLATPAGDRADLKSSMLSDNAGWRADRLMAIGPK